MDKKTFYTILTVCICVLTIISMPFAFTILKNKKVGKIVVTVDKTEYQSGEVAKIFIKNNNLSQIAVPSLDRIIIEKLQNNVWARVTYFPCPCIVCGIALPVILRFNESKMYQWNLYEINCGEPSRTAQPGIYRVGLNLFKGETNVIAYSNNFIIKNGPEINLTTPEEEYAPGCSQPTGAPGGCFGKNIIKNAKLSNSISCLDIKVNNCNGGIFEIVNTCKDNIYINEKTLVKKEDSFFNYFYFDLGRDEQGTLWPYIREDSFSVYKPSEDDNISIQIKAGEKTATLSYTKTKPLCDNDIPRSDDRFGKACRKDSDCVTSAGANCCGSCMNIIVNQTEAKRLEELKIKDCKRTQNAPVPIPCPLNPCGVEPRPVPICQNNLCVDKNTLNRITMTFKDSLTLEPIKNYSIIIKQVILCKPGGDCPEEILFNGSTDANGKALFPPEIFEKNFNLRTSGYIEAGPFQKDMNNPEIYTVSLEGSPYAFNYKKDNIIITLKSDKLLEIEYRGGDCPNGCSTKYAISRMGFFTKDDYTGQNTFHLGKALDQVKITGLIQEIEKADFSLIRSKPFTGVCPTAFDGQEITYKFYTTQTLETVSSCQTEIDYNSELFKTIQSVIEEAK